MTCLYQINVQARSQGAPILTSAWKSAPKWEKKGGEEKEEKSTERKPKSKKRKKSRKDKKAYVICKK